LQLVFLEGKASDRKARLFACGVGFYLLPYLGDERSRRVIEVAEKHADGLATASELDAARESAIEANLGFASHTVSLLGDRFAWQAARVVVISLQQAQAEVSAKDWSKTLVARSRTLLHCVFGNPFSSATINPSFRAWNGGTIVRLSEAIYNDRAFDRLPMLADALEDAGCDDAALLGHCRQPGPHVRGCWVVDLLSGRQ
jgi:hypothetical protein